MQSARAAAVAIKNANPVAANEVSVTRFSLQIPLQHGRRGIFRHSRCGEGDAPPSHAFAQFSPLPLREGAIRNERRELRIGGGGGGQRPPPPTPPRGRSKISPPPGGGGG